MATETQTERRLAVKVDERDTVHGKLEELHRDVDGGNLSEVQRKQAEDYRESMKNLDEEIAALSEQVEADRRAVEKAKEIRRASRITTDGVDATEDGVVYRTMAAYARDVVLSGQGREASKIAANVDRDEVQRARDRLTLISRTPANTLSSNVGGLIPDQHINQIFQVINTSRPLVASARRTTLERGTLTFPKVTQRPVVAVQSTEKTEAGNTGMVVGMETATASTYLGGGDLSWQAINWSTPDALELWFDLAAADYALKTEQDAGEVIQTAAFLNDISTLFGATGTFAEFMTAVAAAMGEVYANSGDIADTLYLAPDRAFYLFGLTSSTPAMFANGSLNASNGSGNIGSLNVVVSRGLDSGVIAVGVANKLIVAETAGAPVELRVVEPAIGGVEVGLIGAFEAVVAEDEAFALLTAAS
jgi:hypothetical protein